MRRRRKYVNPNIVLKVAAYLGQAPEKLREDLQEYYARESYMRMKSLHANAFGWYA